MNKYDEILDLSKYEIQNESFTQGKWKYFTVLNTTNGNKYLAKISTKFIKNWPREIFIDLLRELFISSRLNHPSILKFFGYSPLDLNNKPKLSMIFENATNKTLSHILFTEKEEEEDTSYNNNELLNDTQKLIIIYGIASGMQYLHSNNIIHQNLISENIFLDNSFHPKISGFNFVKEISQNQSTEPSKEFKHKGKKIYLAPEVLTNFEYSKKSDVYSFSHLVFEILTNEKSFKNIKFTDDICEDNEWKWKKMSTIISAVVDEGVRSEFDLEIPESYKSLIERCWSEDPYERPTFDEIVNELKTNKGFITDKVDEKSYLEYVNYVDHAEKTLEVGKESRLIEEIVKRKTHVFCQSDFDPIKKRPLKHDEDFTLKNYELISLDSNDGLFKVGVIEEKETKMKFSAHFCQTEINNFTRNEIIGFIQKVNIMAQLNHPSIQKFANFSPVDFANLPKPVVVLEYLEDTLESLPYCHRSLRRKDESGFNIESIPSDKSLWNDTKKLINIYGIAAGMAYLHSHGILHRDLKPSNIYLDDNNFPKIAGFHLSIELEDKNEYISSSIQGTPAYLSPEIYTSNIYSKSSDVYSFSLILYEIMTNQKPFNDKKSAKEIKEEICNMKTRPSFKVPIPPAYRTLIERCWSEEPTTRPTFDEILDELRTNPDFITESVDKEDFYEYVNFLDNFNATFDPGNRVQSLDDIRSRIHTFHDIRPRFFLKNIYQTEMNDLMLDSDYLKFANFESDKKIKNGKFYSVYKLIDPNTNTMYAEKTSRKAIDSFYKHEIINFSQELNGILQLNHPAILKCFAYKFVFFAEYSSPSIITEYASKGTLKDTIKSSVENDDKSLWNDTKKLISIYGIAAGMAYLHSHGILHRDLKPSNIYLDEYNFPKIAGFHLSIELEDKNEYISSSIQGTPAYLSPEIYASNIYSKSSDVYSFSLILYEIMTNQKPFNDKKSAKEIKEEICNMKTRPSFKVPIPPAYRTLIERCWSEEPTTRPTFDEILYELRTNPDFITESVDKEEYEKYIKYIDETPNSLSVDKKIKQFKEFVQNKLWHFSEYDTTINFRGIYETEEKEVLFNYDFVNVENFEKQKLINNCESYKIYSVLDKEKGVTYTAKKYDKKFISFKQTNFESFNKELNIILELNHPSI